MSVSLCCEKYGFDNFIRSTIKVFDNREDALKLEKLIVDDKFIARKDTYNIVIGGGDPPKMQYLYINMI